MWYAKLIFCSCISASSKKIPAKLRHIEFTASPEKPLQACAERKRHKARPWCKDEQRAKVEVPWGGRARELWRSPGLLRQEAETLLTLSKTLEPSLELDSVDRQPTYETLLVFQMEHRSPEIQKVLKPIQKKLLPYIKARYACKKCVICTVFLRQYNASGNGRRNHPLHFDQDAYVTAVVGLNPHNFSGGLYIQEGEDAKSSRYVALETGDVLLHQFDVRHAVKVHAGVRHSAIFWVKDSASSCSADTSPWYLGHALAGDADAQVNVARMHRKGEGGVLRNLSAAFDWYMRAAVHGHPVAEYYLSRLLNDERKDSLPQDVAAALTWAQRAADHGHAGAQVLYGAMIEEGKGGATGGAAAAEPWYRRSAKQENPWGMYSLGRLYLLGTGGLKKNPRIGKKWVDRAASAGFQLAKELQQQISAHGGEL